MILHRYFWPQPYPYAHMLKEISTALENSGHNVDVYTTLSGLDDESDLRDQWTTSNTINIKALSLGSEKHAGLVKKVLNSVRFALWSFWHLIVAKPDTVLVATTPPVIMAMIVRIASRISGFRYVYHCQDIHPEAAKLGGALKGGLIYRFLLYVDRANIDGAWKIITLSEDMKSTLEKRGCKTSHVHLINNFIFEENIPVSKSTEPLKKVSFLFAGSLGRLQNLEVLMKAILLLKSETGVEFVIMGDGVMYKEMVEIKESNNLENVSFLGQRSVEEAVGAMHEADVGIVSLAPGICEVAYPSKTMMYLGNGLPVFAIVDSESTLYEYINTQELGVAVGYESAEILAESLSQFAKNIVSNPVDRVRIASQAQKDFGMKNILQKHVELYS